MKKTNLIITTIVGIIAFSSCNNPTTTSERYNPIVLVDTTSGDQPLWIEEDGTFSLSVLADSVDGAILQFQLLDGDSVIMYSQTGHFTGIPQREEGYELRVMAEWPDTTMFSPVIKVVGFIHLDKIDPLPKAELEKLLSSCDSDIASGQHPAIAQAVTLVVEESQLSPISTLSEVIQYIKLGRWKGVCIKQIEYDATGHIISLRISPVDEQQPVPAPIETEGDDELLEDW